MADYTAEQYRAAAKKALAAGDVKSANELIAAGMALSKSATNLPEQAGSGTSEGIAGALGTPVDLMTTVINGLVQKPQYEDAGSTLETGLKLRPTNAGPAVAEPFGGGSTFRKLMEPFISDVAPQTTAQRYGRRIGQEIGADAVFGPAAMLAPGIGPAARANLPAYAGTNLVSDVAAGTAGQTAREIAPESDAADFWASLLGGGVAGTAASRMAPEYAPAPTRAVIGAKTDAKYQAVADSGVNLTDDAFARMQAGLEARLGKERATNSSLFPRARATLDDIATNPDKSLFGAEENRRLIGRNVAANADEAKVGVGLKDEIDTYLKSLKPEDAIGPNPAQAVQDLMEARTLAARGHRYDAVDNKAMRGETRAATTGSGGNEVNATRQNIRGLYDKERDPTLRGQRQGFTPDEMTQMERVVMGTDGQNFARRLAKFSPASGAFGMLGGMGGASGLTASLLSGNPWPAIAAVPPTVGMFAKTLSESMTKNEIQKLLDIIANGGKLKPNTARKASEAAVMQQLLSSALQGNQQ